MRVAEGQHHTDFPSRPSSQKSTTITTEGASQDSSTVSVVITRTTYRTTTTTVRITTNKLRHSTTGKVESSTADDASLHPYDYTIVLAVSVCCGALLCCFAGLIILVRTGRIYGVIKAIRTLSRWVERFMCYCRLAKTRRAAERWPLFSTCTSETMV